MTDPVTGPAADGRRDVLVLVGTDHHPFARAVAWADQRQRDHPEEHVVVQHGRTPPPSVATGIDFMDGEEMRERIERAAVVVAHGGPGTINDARAGGHRPIVMGRDPALGEHVDDHQLRFAGWCGERGLVHLVRTPEALEAVVAELGERGTRDAAGRGGTPAGIAVVQATVEQPRRSSRPVLPGSAVVLAVGAGRSPEREAVRQGLARVPGALLLGAVAALPEDLRRPTARCACGRPPDACPLWSRVLERCGDPAAVPGPPPASALLPRHLSRPVRHRVTARAGWVTAAVDAAVELTGARFAVDDSDRPGVLVLGRASGLDVRIVVVPGTSPAAALGRGVLARRLRLPVLAGSAGDDAAALVGRLAGLSLPPARAAGSETAVGHGPDARLTVAS